MSKFKFRVKPKTCHSFNLFNLIFWGLWIGVVGWRSADILKAQSYQNQAQHFENKALIGEETDEDYDRVLENILSHRQARRELIKKSKKAKYTVSEKISGVAFSADERTMLFKKEILATKKEAELILYQSRENLLQYYSVVDPFSLVEKKNEIIGKFSLIEGSFLKEVNLGKILDHDSLPTTLSYRTHDLSKLKKNQNLIKIDLHLEDGRNRILGGSLLLQENFSGPISLKEMYYSSDGMIGVFIVSYEVADQHDLIKHEKLLPLNFDNIIANYSKLLLRIEEGYRLTQEQKKIIFLKEEYFNLSGKFQDRYDYFQSGFKIRHGNPKKS